MGSCYFTHNWYEKRATAPAFLHQAETTEAAAASTAEAEIHHFWNRSKSRGISQFLYPNFSMPVQMILRMEPVSKPDSAWFNWWSCYLFVRVINAAYHDSLIRGVIETVAKLSSVARCRKNPTGDHEGKHPPISPCLMTSRGMNKRWLFRPRVGKVCWPSQNSRN